ncbi:MAG: class C sortase [Tissierellia bacterium]|nr:class C sortase [Tissierellia bacterium]
MSARTQTKLAIFLGLILILGSAGFLLFQSLKTRERKAAVEAFEKELEEGLAQEAPSPQEGEGPQEEEEAQEPLPPSGLGVVRIDKLGVVLPIYGDASGDSLAQGAGLVQGTDFPGPYPGTTSVLAAHRGGRQETQSFMHIDRLEPGDLIQVTSQEASLTYEVVGQQVIEPRDWSHFDRQEGKTRLFLLTCHPYPKNNKRLLLEAQLIDSQAH